MHCGNIHTMTSDIYVHEMGPKLTENRHVVINSMSTPATERPLRCPSRFWELTAASTNMHRVIMMVPNSSGFRRPTLSEKKNMNMQSIRMLYFRVSYTYFPS